MRSSCELCQCDRASAWPRVFLRDGEKDEERGFLLAGIKIPNAIDAGCRACALLKEGVELFHSLQSLKPFDGDFGHFCNRRAIDKA
jgi:hypothetical protein